MRGYNQASPSFHPALHLLQREVERVDQESLFKPEDVSLEVIGQVIARVPVKNYIARMEQVLAERPRKAAKKKK